MTKDEILDGIRAVVAEQFHVAPQSITRDTIAMDVAGWDSVTHVHVMLAIEGRFRVKIPDERVFSMDNIGELVDILAELLAQR